MGETDVSKAGPVSDAIRSVFSALDRASFWVLGLIYQLFFNVATSSIISSDTILKFYNRVQLVLGVYMLFRLALIIIKGIVNPEDFMKSGGSAGKLVKRIIVVLLIFSTLIPMTGISPRNSLEEEIHDNGILFGVLYSLQSRILANNTLGKLILGTSKNAPDYWSGDENSQEALKKSANMFTSSITKGFYRINLIPAKSDKGEDTRNHRENTPDDRIKENWMCPNMSEELLNTYKDIEADPLDIIAMVNEKCTFETSLWDRIKKWFSNGGIFSLLIKDEVYVFTYMPVIGTIVAIIFIFILASFTVDIAIRSIKLAILRLIAPIPLISYMDPNGSKDSSFNAWVKTLTSTYLDLFIRLSIIFFVIFIIQDTIVNGIVINISDGVLGIISLIIIWIALFIFAKQAPKFLRQAMGAKEGNFSLFGGLSDVVGTVGAAGATALGGIAAARSSRQASRDADEKNGRNAKSLVNRGKHLLAGAAGLVSGTATGARAAWGAKDHQGRAAFDAISRRNARVRELGSQGSTFLGGVGSTLRQAATGRSGYDVMEQEWNKEEKQIKKEQDDLKIRQDALKTREDAFRVEQTNNGRRKSITDRAMSKAADSDDTVGSWGVLSDVNYRKFRSTYEAAKSGVGLNKDYVDSSGNSITAADYSALSDTDKANYRERTYFKFNDKKIDMTEASIYDQELLKSNASDYYRKAVANRDFDSNITADRDAYHTATGNNLESDFGNLKAQLGKTSAAISSESDAISRERRDIAGISQDLTNRSIALNNKKNEAKAKAAKANAGRFTNNGKK